MKSELMLEAAVNFMINSMFACIGALIIAVTILVINNLFHRYWKTVDFFPMPKSSGRRTSKSSGIDQ